MGRISAFGLLEMSRQRLRPGMLEATTQPCRACHGTGLIRSDDSLALSILRQLEEEGPKRRAKEVTVTAPVRHRELPDERKARLPRRDRGALRPVDPDRRRTRCWSPPDYRIDRSKTATRRIVAAAPVISMDATLMDDIEEEADSAPEEETTDVVETPRPSRGRGG